LSHPSLLVLDDATSALDTVTERKVLNNIRSLQRNGGHATTVLIVASKLSTIMLADRVLLLSDGHISAHGTHAQLLETNAEYRELMGLNDGS
ncbi:MAG: ABC transporter ATP-binding protein, partial [Pseudomonadota bacterium]